MKNQKQVKHRKNLYKRLLTLFFVLVLIVSSSYFTEDFKEYYKVKKEYKEIKNQTKKEKTIDWNALRRINKDILAWIEIPNTPVDYPVVQAKTNSEYLHKDIHGSYSMYGSIFLDERLYNSNLSENPNNIIYGHNMGRWTNCMFGSLKEYLNSDYLKNHEKVILYTQKNTYYYQVAAVELATASSSAYYIDFERDKFVDWVDEQISKSIYQCLDSSMIGSYTNNFYKSKENLRKSIKKYGNTLTLSTCDTTHDDRNKIVLFCIPNENLAKENE